MLYETYQLHDDLLAPLRWAVRSARALARPFLPRRAATSTRRSS